MRTLEYAKYYIGKGFSVIPLHAAPGGKCTCGNDQCSSPGKHPAIKTWAEYQRRHANNDELTTWFGNGVTRNIGIVTGPISGIAVVDCDGPQAVEFGKKNKFAISPLQRTGRESGFHLFYQYCEGADNFQNRPDFPQIDCRGKGGYVVAAPSVHASGKPYTWLKDRTLEDVPLAPFPEILLKKPEAATPLKELYQGTTTGDRNNALARLCGSWAADGLTLAECLENARIWNDKNQPPLSAREIETTVKSIFNKHQKEKKTEEKGAAPEVTFDPLRLPTGLTLQAMEIHIEWLIKGLLPKQAITVLHGRGGIGKTWLSLQIAESIAKGTPLFGLNTVKVPVYYIDFENPLPVLVERVKALNIQHVYFWHISNEIPPPALDALNGDNYHKLPEGSLVIFDTFRSAHTGDENDSRDISRVLTVLKRLRETGSTILLLHHTSKGNDSRYKGSTAILDLCDHELNLCDAQRKDGEQDTFKRLFTPQKSRYQTEELTLDFDIDEGGFFAIPDQTEETQKTIYKILSELPEDQRKKTTLIDDHLKPEMSLSRNELRRLLDKGVGKFWTTKQGERNATFYTAIPVCQFAGLYRGRQTEKLNSDTPTQSGKLTDENNPQTSMVTEFASLPEGVRQTEKLDDSDTCDDVIEIDGELYD